MLVIREFRFEAAHHRPAHPGKGRHPPRHAYPLHVASSAPVDPAPGMAIDFGDPKRIVHDQVHEHLDHRDLNEVMDVPSAENIAAWIWDRLAGAGLPLSEVKLFETSNCWVVYRGEGLERAAP